MYYGRYSREARRWIKSWPLPSELIKAKHPQFQIVDSDGSSDDSSETSDDAKLKQPAE